MNWYKGDIAEAVAESRQKNAIFVVYIAGKDSNTDRLTSMLDDEKIRSQLESDSFVAIRIESDSQSYMQFASIYQVVPVPSIFFIGMSGVPIEIGTSTLQSIDELDGKIKNALSGGQNNSASGSAASSSSSFIAAEKVEAEKGQQHTEQSVEKLETETEEKDSPKEESEKPLRINREIAGATEIPETSANIEQQQEVICENGVCYKKQNETTADSLHENSDSKDKDKTDENVEPADLNARLEATRKLLEQKRRERIEEEKLLEKEREIRRRREGREMQNLQEWQREQELKELKDNIRRERLEEQAARERIRAQIAADRAERAQKFAIPAANADSGGGASKQQASKSPTAEQQQQAKTNTVRLQFRLPDGDIHTNTFKPTESILSVREYVSRTLLASTAINDFVLAAAYPKYEFTAEDDQKTLLDMGLYPSAVILVLTKASNKPAAIIARSGGVLNIMTSIFWTVFSPVISILTYLRNVLPGQNVADGVKKRRNEDDETNNDASKRRNLDRFMMTGPSTSKETENFQSNEQNNDTKLYRRYGSSNVHRLSDKRKDSDDENATWNGNSTQQQ